MSLSAAACCSGDGSTASEAAAAVNFIWILKSRTSSSSQTALHVWDDEDLQTRCFLLDALPDLGGDSHISNSLILIYSYGEQAL